MLRLIQLEEIEALLREAGGLVGLQEDRDPDFAAQTLAWLKRFESALEANGLVEAALIAGLRSAIASAASGTIPPGVVTRGQPTRSKVVALLAGQALQRCVEIGATIVASNRQRYAEAELVAQRLVAALRSLDVVVPEDLMATHGEWLHAVRRVVAGRAELEPAMVHLEGLVGPADALVLLDRALGASARVTPAVLEVGPSPAEAGVRLEDIGETSHG